jgi:hypothetical protein
MGFQQAAADKCLYVFRENDAVIYLLVYVDDLLFASNDDDLTAQVKSELCSEYKMTDLGILRSFLGMRIIQNEETGCITVDQENFARSILETAHMDECKSVSTPTGEKLTQNMCPTSQEEKDFMAKIPYRQVVGKLIYLMTGTRPDIAYAVGEVSKFCANPGRSHWTAVKRILRYLRGTVDRGITFSRRGNSNLIGFCDADWAGDKDTRRSTTGYIFQLANGPISWKSKRQPTVALSTCEAEYMACAAAVQEAIWLRLLMNDLDMVQGDATVIHNDNQGTIALSKDPVYHARSKHIDIRHHFVQERVAAGDIVLRYMPSTEMPADMLTKALDKTLFERLRQVLMNSQDNQRKQHKLT